MAEAPKPPKRNIPGKRPGGPDMPGIPLPGLQALGEVPLRPVVAAQVGGASSSSGAPAPPERKKPPPVPLRQGVQSPRHSIEMAKLPAPLNISLAPSSLSITSDHSDVSSSGSSAPPFSSVVQEVSQSNQFDDEMLTAVDPNDFDWSKFERLFAKAEQTEEMKDLFVTDYDIAVNVEERNFEQQSAPVPRELLEVGQLPGFLSESVEVFTKPWKVVENSYFDESLDKNAPQAVVEGPQRVPDSITLLPRVVKKIVIRSCLQILHPVSELLELLLLLLLVLIELRAVRALM